MHKNIFLLIMLVCWAGVISYFCLADLQSSPLPSIENLDKIVHAFFYFVFSIIFTLYLKTSIRNYSQKEVYLYPFFTSIAFGLIIEFLQATLTTTRQAELYDVFANIFGATLSGFTMFFSLNIIVKTFFSK